MDTPATASRPASVAEVLAAIRARHRAPVAFAEIETRDLRLTYANRAPSGRYAAATVTPAAEDGTR